MEFQCFKNSFFSCNKSVDLSRVVSADFALCWRNCIYCQQWQKSCRISREVTLNSMFFLNINMTENWKSTHNYSHVQENINIANLIWAGVQQNLQSHLSRLMTKPTEWHMRLAKTQISLGICPGWSESSLCAQWSAKGPSFLHADSEDWSDWVDVQADPSLRWAHMPFCWFRQEAAHLIWAGVQQSLQKSHNVSSEDSDQLAYSHNLISLLCS